MKNPHVLPLFLLASSLFAAPPKPVYCSKVITKKTPGHAVRIKANITGAKLLFLVGAAGGDNSCDHVNWASRGSLGRQVSRSSPSFPGKRPPVAGELYSSIARCRARPCVSRGIPLPMASVHTPTRYSSTIYLPAIRILNAWPGSTTAEPNRLAGNKPRSFSRYTRVSQHLRV